MLSQTAVEAYWDELEKVASTGVAAGLGLGLMGAAAGLGGTALYLHGNAQQDRLLRDVGMLDPKEAQLRQMRRIAAMVGVSAALGVGGAALGGIGAPAAQKTISKAITESTREMWDTAGAALKRGLDEGLQKQVQSGDVLLKKQMEYGRGMVGEVIEEAPGRLLRGTGKKIPFIRRFFKDKPKVDPMKWTPAQQERFARWALQGKDPGRV